MWEDAGLCTHSKSGGHLVYKHTGVRVSQCVWGSILMCERFWIQELLYKWAELGVLEGCVYSALE